MLSLSLGIAAAMVWAVHDLLVRRISRDMPVLPMVLAVLAAGTAALALAAFLSGDWGRMTGPALALSVAAGLAYVPAMGGLYVALAMAPVRLVAPVVGSYPLLSLAIAAAEGRRIGAPEWLAVAAIVAGIAMVALTGRAEGRAARPLRALTWAAAGAAGFAATFWLGQEAARLGAALPAMLVTRATALAVVTAIAAVTLRSVPRMSGRGRVLAAMGVLDALALGLVTGSRQKESRSP